MSNNVFPVGTMIKLKPRWKDNRVWEVTRNFGEVSYMGCHGAAKQVFPDLSTFEQYYDYDEMVEVKLTSTGEISINE